MAPRMTIGQLPAFLIWNLLFFTLLRGGCVGNIFRSLGDEQLLLSHFFYQTRTRVMETIVAARAILLNFFDGDGYFDASLVPKALSLVFGGFFLFFMKLFIVWRRLNYLTAVLFYYLYNMFTEVVIGWDRRPYNVRNLAINAAVVEQRPRHVRNLAINAAVAEQ